MEVQLFRGWDKGDFDLLVPLAQEDWSFAGRIGARVGLSVVDEKCCLPCQLINDAAAIRPSATAAIDLTGSG